MLVMQATYHPAALNPTQAQMLPAVSVLSRYVLEGLAVTTSSVSVACAAADAH